MSRQGKPSRAELGYCKWHHSEQYTQERQRLEDERNPFDPDDPTPYEVTALEFLDALMEAATLDGLGEEQYDAPIGERIPRTNKPWLGELKTPGVHRKTERGSREYRVYFAEPDIEKGLLAALLGHKTAREMRERVRRGSVPKSSGKQTKHVGQAMDIVQRWCRRMKVGYRTL